MINRIENRWSLCFRRKDQLQQKGAHRARDGTGWNAQAGFLFMKKEIFFNKFFQLRDNPDDDQSVFQKLLDSCASSLEVKLSLFLFWLSDEIFQDLFDACLVCDGSGKRVILDFAPFSCIDRKGCELSIIKQIFSKGVNTQQWIVEAFQKENFF